MSAKNATLRKTGSHWVSDDNSSRHNGISKEEIYFYFDATWRGRPVQVEVSADRYAHSSGISDWRVYARAAYFDGRVSTTDTARRALSELCSPIATAWLESGEYVASFQRALAHMIMRKFRDGYSPARNVSQALATFEDRLPSSMWRAIRDTLVAYNTYEDARFRANALINGSES